MSKLKVDKQQFDAVLGKLLKATPLPKEKIEVKHQTPKPVLGKPPKPASLPCPPPEEHAYLLKTQELYCGSR